MASLALNFRIDQFSSENTSTKMHEWVTFDAHKALKSDGRWTILWKTAAIATFVAFAVISALATIGVAVYAMVYLPVLTTALLIAMLPLSYKLFAFFWNKATLSENSAKENRLLVEQLDKLPKDSKELSQLLGEYGIQKINSQKANQDLTILRPLIARAKSFEAETKRHLKEIEKLEDLTTPGEGKEKVELNKFGKINQINTESQKEMNYYNSSLERDVKILACRINAALSKIDQAYSLKILSEPHTLDPITKSINLINWMSPPVRLIAKAQGDQDWQTVVSLKDGKKNSFTIEDILKMSPQEVAKELFAVS